MADQVEDMPDATRNLDTIPHDAITELVLPTPDGGEVTCHRMPAMNSAHIILDSPHDNLNVVIVAIYSPWTGGFVPMTPNDARTFAMAVLRSADAADAGYGRRAQ